MRSNIYVLLDQVKKRKAMFLGNDYNFQSLNAFVTGYLFAANEEQLKTNEFNDFSYFNIWLLGYLEIGKSSFGWYHHIKERNLESDENAFDMFFKLLEVFKVDRPIECVFQTKIGKVSDHFVQNDRPEVSLKKLKFTSSKIIWLESLTPETFLYDNWFYGEMEFKKRVEQDFEVVNE